MPRIYFVLIFTALASAADADSLRCGKRLIGVGDRQFEVRRACGEPDITVVINSFLTLQYGPIPYDEEWQYNFGPNNFMRFLRFRNGKLTNVETGPYGFSEPARYCSPIDLSTGLSSLELLGRCGPPNLVERRIAEQSYSLGPTYPVFPVGTPVEDWVYEFDTTHFYRVAVVIEGTVIKIETGDRRNL